MNASSSATASKARRATVAVAHARRARDLHARGRRAVILSGGELTVTLHGKGRGGPNQEYALGLALALDGAPGIAALAGDTDGTDGGTGRSDDPPAPWWTIRRSPAPARSASIPPTFSPTTIRPGSSARLGDLLVPGPTFTNVNDFRAIVVDLP